MPKNIEPKLKEGDPAPDFTALTRTGALVTLSQFKGHPVIL